MQRFPSQRTERETQLLLILLLLVAAGAALYYFVAAAPAGSASLSNTPQNTMNYAAVPVSLTSSTSSTSSTTSTTSSSVSTTSVHPGSIDHVIIIMMENKGYSSVIRSSDAPYQNSLTSKYALAANYYAVSHPSLPNYLALISGDTFGERTNCLPSECTLSDNTITTLLDAKGMSWKEYAESMPGNCSQDNSPDGLYAPKHNPFVYFSLITGNNGVGSTSAYCNSHDVPMGQFWSDLQANALPNYSFITPNLCDDSHDCPLITGDQWLWGTVPKIISSNSFATSAVFVLYDEADKADLTNHIPLILVSPFAKQGYVSQVSYTHYSLLNTVEYLLGLGNLGSNDLTANAMTALFTNQTFAQPSEN